MPFHFPDLLGDIAVPDFVLDLVESSLKVLEAQADGKWKRLPDPLVRWLGPHYSFDLSEVWYAEEIATPSQMAVTVERWIYFPKAIDLSTEGHVHWLMHELRHCEQYREKGGRRPFLEHYAEQVFQNVIDHGTFNVHGLIDMEQEAEDKANRLNDQMAGLLAARRVALRSHGGAFLSARGGKNGPIIADGEGVLERETFWLVAASPGTVAIAAFDGRFVTLDALGGAVTDSITVGGAEPWTTTPLGGDLVAIRSADGRFLRAVVGDVMVGGTVVGDPETFRVIDV